MSKRRPADTALRVLRESYARNGYLRTAPPRQSGTHRGYELRFTASTVEERDTIVECLEAIGFDPGRPFAKANAWRVPVYGKAKVDALATLLRP